MIIIGADYHPGFQQIAFVDTEVEGDAAVIRAKRGRRPKTDRQDALHILNLLLKNDFPMELHYCGLGSAAGVIVRPYK